MEKLNEDNGFCTIRIIAESPAAAEFGREIKGKVMGRDHIEIKEDYLRDLYPNQNEMNVLRVEDENGKTCQVPEKDVERVIC